MKQISVVNVFTTVTAGALLGMLLGGGFGYGSGSIAPDLFKHLFPWQDFEPVGTATVIGAAGGVFCGAGLAAFAVVVQVLTGVLARRATKG